MNYRFQFGVVWENFHELLEGAWLTFQLGVFAFAGGALIGLFCAAVKTYAPQPFRFLVDTYVVFITNTPALIQIYFLYFGLPEVGVRWSNEACLLIGLTLNAGAYLTLILRAGFISVRVTEIEAGQTLGMSLFQQVRYIISRHNSQHFDDLRHFHGIDEFQQVLVLQFRKQHPLLLHIFDHAKQLLLLRKRQRTKDD